MNPEWPSDGIPKFILVKFIVTREYLDSFRLGIFDQYAQPTRQVDGIQTPVASREGFCGKDPQMTPTAGMLQGRFEPVRFHGAAELQQISDRRWVISVHGQPF